MIQKIANKIKRLFFCIKRLYWKKKLGKCGNNVVIGKNIVFQYAKCLLIESDVRIGDNTLFLPCTEYEGVKYNPSIIIHSGCAIGKSNSFACIDKIEIGRNVLFAGFVHVTDHSHGYEDVNTPIKKQRLISKGPIVIDDDCWLGFQSEILSGVHIGKHSIVAARAVVTKDVPAYSIVAGNPAKVVKQYNFETKIWETARK